MEKAEPSLAPYWTNILPLLAENAGNLELVPEAGARIENGKVQLAFARDGTPLEYSLEKSARMPTLDLAQAGISTESRPPSELIKAASEYLKGRRFALTPSEPMNFNFLFRAYVTDRWEGFMYALRVDVTANLAKMPGSNITHSDLDDITEEGDKTFKKLTITAELASVGERVPGVDLSGTIALYRMQLINLVLPKKTQGRDALNAFMAYLELSANYDMAKEDVAAARKRWWFWLTEWIVRRRKNLADMAEELEGRAEKMNTVLGVLTKSQ